MSDEKHSDRVRRILVAHATIGDGKTLCCSVDTVYELVVDCETLSRADGAIEMFEKLKLIIGADALRVGLAFMHELKELTQQRIVRAQVIAQAKES